ncbi:MULTISPECIES: hypothetical protein [unclassified Mycobacterium]|uniref:hypothetical protein n=1 Tax=unclassified Mycobacterium TaxID=2642494 RepID=UPI0029C6BC2A|nr:MULTISPECIES: hypothetical protein [unclassified Mycobacterium]
MKLKEPGEVSATFIATEACKEHRDAIYNKTVEWVLEIGKDPMNPRWHQETLILGEDLQALDEHVLQDAPTLRERPDLYSRIFSDDDTNGIHLDLPLRLRGSSDVETVTVVIPDALVGGLIELLQSRSSSP